MVWVKLTKIGAKMVRPGGYFTFEMAEVAVSGRIFGQILARIARLRALPVPARPERRLRRAEDCRRGAP